MKTLAERFWEKVDIRSDDECWPWLASITGRGYGQFNMANGMARAHRLAFFLYNGYWPNVCRHSCDYKRCCNPKHLLDGTEADNAKDRVARGLIPSGDNHWSRQGRPSSAKAKHYQWRKRKE